jgi:ribosomal protein L40E
MEGIVVILIFFAVIALTALIFVAWLIASVFRLGLCLLSWMFGGKARHVRAIQHPERPMMIPSHSAEPLVCSNRLCVALNPPGARFCRRCGTRQVQPLPVIARRAAV